MAKSLHFALIALTAILIPTAQGAVRTDARRIAVRDQVAPFSIGGEVYFATLGDPMINNDGEIAFNGRVHSPVADLIYDSGIWVTEGGVLTERLREGATIPGATGPVLLASVSSLVFNDAGDVAFFGHSDETGHSAGYWLSSTAETIALAIENSPSADPNYEYANLNYSPAVNNQGQVAANISVRETGTTERKYAIAVFDSSSVGFAAIQGEPAPGTGSEFDEIFRATPPVNASGQTAFVIGLVDPVTQERIGTAAYAGTPQALELVAQTGMSAPGTDTTFDSVGVRGINDAGDTVLAATLVETAETNAENNGGLWRTRNGALELLVREGDLALPATADSPAAYFSNFLTGIISDNDQVVFTSYLRGEGIVGNSRSTLWSVNDGELQLLIDSSVNAPGTSDSFGSFFAGGFTGNLAANRNGQLVVRALAGTRRGIWAQDPSGTMRLVVRTGDMLETASGEFHMVTEIDFFSSFTGGSDGYARTINDSGEIVYQVTFDNGVEGIFTTDVASYFAADFDRDGDVDDADLTHWHSAYPLGEGLADADGDGATTGKDLLLWQRQHGLGVMDNSIAAVPEPTCFVLATAISVILTARLRPTV